MDDRPILEELAAEDVLAMFDEDPGPLEVAAVVEGTLEVLDELGVD